MEGELSSRSRIDDSRPRAQPQQLCSPPRRDSSPVFSSPPPASGKEKRNPSVTPRRFRKFFTPATRSMRGRRILADVEESVLNRQPITPRSSKSNDVLNSGPLYPPASQESACGNAQRRKRGFQHMAREDQEQTQEQTEEQYDRLLTTPFRAVSPVPESTVPRVLAAPAPVARLDSEFQLQTSDPAQLEDWRKTTLVATTLTSEIYTYISYILTARCAQSQFFRASRSQLKPPKDELPVEIPGNKTQKRAKQKVSTEGLELAYMPLVANTSSRSGNTMNRSQCESLRIVVSRPSY